ncbi:hypothetical protein [Candidatus Solincola tengchongensis]|uniref:hypothetical protein n=1 Tax=Candidatus Solincola tengchongensis TaxID=2900693 RepID=UPI00257AFE39|nr:hypothetical protein [Candidatus Solincola tengchongensis]
MSGTEESHREGENLAGLPVNRDVRENVLVPGKASHVKERSLPRNTEADRTKGQTPLASFLAESSMEVYIVHVRS